MRKVIAIGAILFSYSFGFAQTTKWTYDVSHAKIGFTISHFGISETEGKFTKFDGAVYADKPDFSDAKIDLTIDLNSISTEDEQRDKHLKSPDFLILRNTRQSLLHVSHSKLMVKTNTN